jgi:hypothetical protein
MNRVPLSLWFVIGQLIVAALLIAVPAVRAPSNSDACNAPSFEIRDEVDAKKSSAAKLVLVGALVSLAAAITAFVSTSGRTRAEKVPFLVVGMLGVMGLVTGLAVAVGIDMVIC